MAFGKHSYKMYEYITYHVISNTQNKQNVYFTEKIVIYGMQQEDFDIDTLQRER